MSVILSLYATPRHTEQEGTAMDKPAGAENTALVEGGPNRAPCVEDVYWTFQLEFTSGPARPAHSLYDFACPPMFDGKLEIVDNDDVEVNGPWDSFEVVATSSGGNAKRFKIAITEIVEPAE
jgi:hypothetical protein